MAEIAIRALKQRASVVAAEARAGTGLLDPVVLRSLDAPHLSTALELGDDVDGLATDGDRMAKAAQDLGITVLAPGPASQQV
ncbi:hypothetical protein [Brachybacterium sp. p3-SID957]|uniref:hypothetical protein n=1 Tax=Brachybacterium sp. p3-SID957 TaxID=2916049 RepID=UPI00223C19C9|nr:hypothetical protein [Brachybacterium sp. p3-SID957]MCT1775718.1 hypothetical protein [Brachybacterium sp. p3-SID957]